MAAYVIGAAQDVKDPAGFAEYGQLARATVAKYGGKRVLGGGNIEVGDGTWAPVRIVVLEFESLECAKEWYNSPEYTAAKSRRFQSADSSLIFVDEG